MPPILITALYKFVKIDDKENLKKKLHVMASSSGVLGMLLLAEEGINGTIAAPIDGMKSFLKKLNEDERFTNVVVKHNQVDENPFLRMRVRLKQEIVSLGIPDINPCELVGTYVNPKDWNSVITDPNTTVIDTRNDYEVAIGTFDKAINPNTKTFKEFPEFCKTIDKTKPVAMFCTGGIRCEKASSYLLQEGFSNVKHLKGGILKYLEEVPEEESKWSGDCYVFDNRVGVTHGLKPGSYTSCKACRMPISKEDIKLESYKEGVSCRHCFGDTTDAQKARFTERQHQVELAATRGVVGIGSGAADNKKIKMKTKQLSRDLQRKQRQEHENRKRLKEEEEEANSKPADTPKAAEPSSAKPNE